MEKKKLLNALTVARRTIATPRPSINVIDLSEDYCTNLSKIGHSQEEGRKCSILMKKRSEWREYLRGKFII